MSVDTRTPTTRSLPRRLAAAALVLGAPLALSACAGASPQAVAAPPRVLGDCVQPLSVLAGADGVTKVSATELRPGPVRMTVTNSVEKPALVSVIEPKRNTQLPVILRDIAALLGKDEKAAAESAKTMNARYAMRGGVIAIGNRPQTVVVDLKPGTYYVTDFATAGEPDAVADTYALRVQGPKVHCDLPADLTVTAETVAGQDRFTANPATIRPGGTIRVHNTMDRPAESLLLPIADGVTQEQVERFLATKQGPNPFTSEYAVGGILPVGPREEAWFPANVWPGRYAYVSLVEDAGDRPYLVTLITVAD